MKTYKRNNTSDNTKMTNSVNILNVDYNSLQDIKATLDIQTRKVHQAADMVIEENLHRLKQKFDAKWPYLIRSKPIREKDGSIRQCVEVWFNKILNITDRGVIFRATFKAQGWWVTSCAIELSHEQMEMTNDEWATFVDGYGKFIEDTYGVVTQGSALPIPDDGMNI